MDDLSIAFEGSRKAVNAAIDKICEFTGKGLVSKSVLIIISLSGHHNAWMILYSPD